MCLYIYMFCNLVLVPDVGSVLSYITLGETEGVTTQSVPVALDGVSLYTNLCGFSFWCTDPIHSLCMLDLCIYSQLT